MSWTASSAGLQRSRALGAEAARADARELVQGDRRGDGEDIVETFKVIKGAELDRYRSWITDWEFAGYSPRL
jgi:hypothetical protein